MGWLVAFPVLLGVLTLSKPAGSRKPWWALTALAALVWIAAATSPSDSDQPTEIAVSTPSTTATEETTTSERQTSTTIEMPEAREGGWRSGNGSDLASSEDVDADAFERAAASNVLLAALADLTVEPEHPRRGYDRELFPQWDDEDRDGCDSRCEVLSSQRRSDGGWLSEWDGYVTDDPSELHVDHVVALAEAWDSGADTWSASRRDEFADHLPNLIAVSATANLRKGDKDAAEWFPSRAEANCLWASTVVRVKTRWDLSVDDAEAQALGNLLRTCEDYRPPTTTTTRPPATMTTPPPVPPPTTVAPPPASSCTPGYSPCIPPGPDVDCAGGSGNGPRYIEGPVQVDPGGGDPYDLDRDGNGVGCQS